MSVDCATKTCRHCEKVLSLDEFHRNSKSSETRRLDCKACVAQKHRQWYEQNPERRREISRRWAAANPERKKAQDRRRYLLNREADRAQKRRRKYGITPDELQALSDRQGGRCAVCGTDEAGGRGVLHVDHDHATGRVRGLLCHRCNTGLGLFRDDPVSLQAAIKYLEGQ